MAKGPRKHARKKRQEPKLSEKDRREAVIRLMAGAQAHQRTSVYCLNNPDAKPPNIDWFFFGVVSLELILMSLEQSLRLLLFLHYDTIRADTAHAPHVLYGTMLNKSGGKAGIRSAIVSGANALARLQGIPTMDEKEIRSCLRKHDSSYTNFRHFQLDKHGGVNPSFEFKQRDVQILHCLALGLIALNMDEIKKQGLQVVSSMSVVPESEMTEELRALKESMLR